MLHAMHLFALVATLAARGLCATPACSLPTQIKGNGYSGVCLGDQVTFTCNASSNATTVLRWQSDGFGVIGPAYFSTSDMASKSRVPYNLSLVTTTPVLVSKAMTVVVSSLNGTTISCAETNNGATYTDISTGCINFAAPPSDPSASVVSCTTNSVTLEWSGSLFDGGSNLTNYTLTSSPPTPNCNGSCAVDPTSRLYTFSGLQPGVPYTLGVSGTNCGGTQQGAKSTVSVTLPVSSPLKISVCTIYDPTTNQISQLSSTWSSPLPGATLANNLQCSPPPSNYTVTYGNSDGVIVLTSLVQASSCHPSCSDLFSVGGSNSTFYNVSVTGGGIPSASQAIASVNNILKVEVANRTQPVTINCTFLPGLVGTSGCVVTFGTSPDHLPYTSTSSQSGGSGQSVSVQLTINGAPIDPSTTVYYYKASLWGSPQCASVVGQIGQWTGCPLSALGGGAALTPHCTALCAHWTTGLSIANGCVCLTGVVTGAQATYICDDGYMLEGGTRECMGDGAWSGTSSPTCSKTNTSSITPAGSAVQSSPTVIIIAVVCGCGLAFILVLGVVVAMVIYKKHVCNKEGQRYTTTNKQKTLAVKPDALPLQTSEHQDAPYSLKYADVITVRVASGGGVVTKTSAPTGDVTYSTLKDVGVEYDKGRTVINV